MRTLKYWHPVLDSKVFMEGDVVWVEVEPAVGYHEVWAVVGREVLLRHMFRWEVFLRRVRGRWRRFWIRRRRGLPSVG